MKKLYITHLKKLFTTLLVSILIGYTANAGKFTPLTVTDFATAITSSVDHDTILLDPTNGNYKSATAVNYTIASKIITIKAIAGATSKPYLENITFKLGASTVTAISGLYLDGLELNGLSSSANFIQLSGGSNLIPSRIKINNCYMHHIARSVVLSGSGYYVDTLLVNNSVFYSVGGSTDTYPAFGTSNTSHAYKFVKITNSTFSRIGGTCIRLAYNKGLLDQTLIVDHCTLDSLYAASKPFNLPAQNTPVTNTLSFTCSNNIISNCRNLTGLWSGIAWGASVSNVINTTYYKVRATDSIVTTAVTLTNYSTANPQYSDSSLRNYTLNNKTFLTASSTGGIIGDPPRSPANDAYLSNISLDGATLTGFKSSVFLYNVALLYKTTIAPTVNYTTQNSGATAVSTPFGTNGMDSTTILVTAKDGATQNKYKLVYTVSPPSPDATLKTLKFNSTSILTAGVYKYGVALAKGTTTVPENSLFVYATNNAFAIAEITKAASLSDSTSIKVTAQDGTIITYKIGFSVTPWAVTVTASPTDGGTVALAGNKTAYQTNEVATLSAVANSGYKFVSWKNNTSGTKYSIHADTTLTVTQDSSLVAVFELNTAVHAISKAVVSVYPNPSANYITIISEQKSEVTIYNLLGSPVLSKAVDANGSLNIQTLKAGAYIVRIQSGNKQTLVCIVKK
jgi:hypothetical protein